MKNRTIKFNLPIFEFQKFIFLFPGRNFFRNQFGMRRRFWPNDESQFLEKTSTPEPPKPEPEAPVEEEEEEEEEVEKDQMTAQEQVQHYLC